MSRALNGARAGRGPWSSVLLPCALAAVLLAAGPGAARGASPAGQEEDAPEEREADAAPPAAPGAEPEAGSRPESESDSDSDSELPGLLIFEADAPSFVFVNGVIKGRAQPDAPLEVRVELGELKIRAIGIEARGAAWERTIELDEPGERTVHVRMERAIRLWRREERKSAVFRDAKTHLMWPKKDNGLDVDLRKAHAHCSGMETAGFDDWRLPLLEELRSLESIWQRAAYKIKGEIQLSECCMWSSEYDGSERAWTFNFRFRKAFQTNAGYAIGLRALCVREWSPETESGGQEGGEAEGESPGAGPTDG